MSVDGGLGAIGRIGDPGKKPRMPGRAHWQATCAGALAISITVSVAGALTRPEFAGPLFALLAGQLLAVSAAPLVRSVRLRRLSHDDRYRTVHAEEVSAAILTAAGPSGVREVTVRVGQVAGFARNFRAGPRAIVLVHERLPLLPDVAGFFIAHEAGHLARYDSVRRPLIVMTALVCWCILPVIWLPTAAIGAVAVIPAITTLNWLMELDCDRLAVRWVGLGPAEHGFSIIAAARRQEGGRTPLRVARSLLRHPPPGRRRLAASRVTRR